MFWLNISTALGTAFLAVPVLYLDRSKKLLQEIREEDKKGLTDTEFGKKIRDIALEKQKDKVAEWHPWQRFCLFGGYGLVALGAIGRIFIMP